MELSIARQGEIALAMLKLKFKKDKRMPDADDLKRDIGNFSKETKVSKEELTAFFLLVFKEMTSEFILEMEKK